MAEERERTGNNAGTDGQQRDPPLQWDGGGNREPNGMEGTLVT